MHSAESFILVTNNWWPGVFVLDDYWECCLQSQELLSRRLLIFDIWSTTILDLGLSLDSRDYNVERLPSVHIPFVQRYPHWCTGTVICHVAEQVQMYSTINCIRTTGTIVSLKFDGGR